MVKVSPGMGHPQICGSKEGQTPAMVLRSRTELPPTVGHWQGRLHPALKPTAEASWELQHDRRNSSHQQLPSSVQSPHAVGLAESLEDELASHWVCICFHLDLHEEIKAAAQGLRRIYPGAFGCTILPHPHLTEGLCAAGARSIQWSSLQPVHAQSSATLSFGSKCASRQQPLAECTKTSSQDCPECTQRGFCWLRAEAAPLAFTSLHRGGTD